jgi:hypothetical protein
MASSQSAKRASNSKSSRRRQPGSRRAGSARGETNSRHLCFDDLLARGAGVWDDEEFEYFQAWLRQGR